MAPKIYLSFSEVLGEDMKILLKKIKEKVNLKKEIKLLIPCRGWEIIWSIIKNNLGLQEKDIFRIKFSNLTYEGGHWIEVLEKESYQKLIEESKKENVEIIFIDDLVDSGDTIKKIKWDLKNVKVFVLYTKEGMNKDLVDGYVKDLPNLWIVFPWENYYKK